jgi:hypothetical protein
MSGISYELVPEAEAPDTLQPGVSRYVEQADGTILQYIGDEDGNPVLVSGRGRVLYAADLHAVKDGSNSKTIYTDVLGHADLYYNENSDWDNCVVDFNSAPPDSTRVKTRLHSTKIFAEDFSMRYAFDGNGNAGSGQLLIAAQDAAADSSVITTPGEFHFYVEVVQH